MGNADLSSDLKHALRKTVIDLRAKMGLTQTELSKLAHVSRQQISNIECAKPFVGYELIFKLSLAFGMGLGEFNYMVEENMPKRAQELSTEESPQQLGLAAEEKPKQW